MGGFGLRGLEIHSSRMWQLAQVRRTLDLMGPLGLNALIFHQNDLIDQLVLPLAYFPEELMWKRNPVRMHTVYNNRAYINTVVREARDAGVELYVEVKELSFPELLPEIVPGLMNPDGSLCPHHPFWWQFLSAKVAELLEVVPDLAGVIVSPGSRESKVSISTNRCSCEGCRSRTPLDWYASLLAAMHGPLAAAGKTLAVRDFSYTVEQQSLMIAAADRCSERVVVTLKNTPHDYYPNFPHNPRIGDCGAHRQWVEFDAWGQFYGMGFFPVGIVEDIRSRIEHCRAKGVDGVWFRTDWEVINEASCANSLNLLNVFAGAMLASDPEADSREIHRRWASYGLVSPLKSGSIAQVPAVPTAAGAADALAALMRDSWKVMEKAVYVRGHLFHEDDQYPNSVERAFDMMVRIHGRDQWEPGASKRLEPTAENIAIIYAEKAAAVAEAARLSSTFDPRALGVPEELAADLAVVLELYVLYVEGFARCARACFSLRRAQVTRAAGDVEAARGALDGLADLRGLIAKRLDGTRYPHYVYWLLDEKRVAALAADVERGLASL